MQCQGTYRGRKRDCMNGGISFYSTNTLMVETAISAYTADTIICCNYFVKLMILVCHLKLPGHIYLFI